MKKILSLTFLLLPILLISQTTIGTNHDEFKYLNKGYAFQKEKGLDGSKQGYSLHQLFTASNEVNFQGLFNEEFSLVGMIVEIDLDTKSPIFIGLPTNDSSDEIQELAETEKRKKLNLDAKEKFDIAIQEFALAQIGGGIKNNKYTNRSKQSLKSMPSNSEAVPKEYDTVSPLKIDKVIEDTQRSKGDGFEEGKENNTFANVDAKHDFKERTLLNAISVRGKNPATGTVVIKMCIDIDGKIKSAKFTQRGSTTMHPELRKMALLAAKDAKFSKGLDPEQCGTISFKFK